MESEQAERLIQEVADKGKLTLDLTQIITEALRGKFRPATTDGPSDAPDQQDAPFDDFIYDDAVFEDANDEIFQDSPGESSDEAPDTPELSRKRPSRYTSDSSSSSTAGSGFGGGSLGGSYNESLAGSDSAEEEDRVGRDYGVEGWGRGPDPRFDARNPRMTADRRREIMNNPLEYIEFVYQNRRFKLKPVGTMEPVPKRVYFGNNGGAYYYKERSSDGTELPMGQWTKVYLKDYQWNQCFRGRSERARGGLAGYVDVNGSCLVPPGGPRIQAARPSKTMPPVQRAAAAASVVRRHGPRNRRVSTSNDSSLSYDHHGRHTRRQGRSGRRG